MERQPHGGAREDGKICEGEIWDIKPGTKKKAGPPSKKEMRKMAEAQAEEA